MIAQGLKICVKSCKNLEPAAYIYTDPDLNGKERCVRVCPDDKPFIDPSADIDHP